MELKFEERRSFIILCLKALGVVGIGGVLYSVFNFLSKGDFTMTTGGSLGENSGAGLIEVGSSQPAAGAGRMKDGSIELDAGSIPEGASMIVSVGYTPVIVVHSSDGFKAFNATCSHLGCLVKWEDETNNFTCPCHGGRYDSGGQVIEGPPPMGLKICNVVEDGGKLKISL